MERLITLEQALGQVSKDLFLMMGMFIFVAIVVIAALAISLVVISSGKWLLVRIKTILRQSEENVLKNKLFNPITKNKIEKDEKILIPTE